MKKLLLVMLLVSTTTIAAPIYFLINQWWDYGQHLCQYSNGVVLSVGMDLCPLHIK